MWLFLAALLTGATPAPAPPGVAGLLLVVDELERLAPTEEDKARLAKPRKALRAATPEKPLPPGELARIAEELVALGPDLELVHTQALRVLLETMSRTEDSLALQQRIHTRAASFVARNPTSVPGHQLYADVLGATGDEEGQLRALAACGEGCHDRFVDSARRWMRLRCSENGVASGLVLRIGSEVIARAEDVEFLEPIAASNEAPARCVLQLVNAAKSRLRQRTASASMTRPETLIVLHGVLLVVDVPVDQTSSSGPLLLPPVVCDRLCKTPRPRALPSGLEFPEGLRRASP